MQFIFIGQLDFKCQHIGEAIWDARSYWEDYTCVFIESYHNRTILSSRLSRECTFFFCSTAELIYASQVYICNYPRMTKSFLNVENLIIKFPWNRASCKCQLVQVLQQSTHPKDLYQAFLWKCFGSENCSHQLPFSSYKITEIKRRQYLEERLQTTQKKIIAWSASWICVIPLIIQFAIKKQKNLLRCS